MTKQDAISQVQRAFVFNRTAAYRASEALERVDRSYRKSFKSLNGLDTISCRKWGMVNGQIDQEKRARLLAEFAVKHAHRLEDAGVYDYHKKKKPYISGSVKRILVEYCTNGSEAPPPEPEPEEIEAEAKAEAPPEPDQVAVPEGQEAIWGALGIEAAVQAAMAKTKDALIAQVRSEVQVIEHKFIDGDEVRTVEGVQHKRFDEAIRRLRAGNHLWMFGPAGCGKSYMAEFSIPKALGVKPENVCVISAQKGQSPSVMEGYLLPVGENGSWVCTNSRSLQVLENADEPSMLVIDEVCNLPPELLSGLNRLLESGTWEIAKRIGYEVVNVDWTNTFLVFLDNTSGRGGDRTFVRQKMDGATLDRFSFVRVDNDKGLEKARFGQDMVLLKAMWALRDKVEQAGIAEPIGARQMKEALGLRLMDGDRYTVERCMSAITEGWNDNDRNKVGIVHHD